MSSRGQGSSGSGDMHDHTGAAMRKGWEQENRDATQDSRVPEGRLGGRLSEIYVTHCFFLCTYCSSVFVLVGYRVVSGQSHA
eukprot:4762683-Prymnesium_polylepis.1